ncbi:transcriptional regulator [Sesbania bispinosa]|nr:transcriptional regulator [Sesbania bispinosa]
MISSMYSSVKTTRVGIGISTADLCCSEGVRRRSTTDRSRSTVQMTDLQPPLSLNLCVHLCVHQMQ